MSGSERIGVGFIGTGDIARVHRAALLKCDGADLVAVYDILPERCAAFVQDSAARVCESAYELVNLPEVDVVFVLTSLQAHFENAMTAIGAGKHTFVEKPVSLSKKEVRQMITAAQAEHVLCVPGHNYIHSAPLKNTRELVQGGKLGEIYGLWIFFMLSLPPEICARIPGVLREVMIHHFYSLLFLLGKPETVFATTSDPRGLGRHKEDQALVVCKMRNGALAHLFGSFCADDLTSEPWTVKFKVVGSEGATAHSWSDSRLRSRPQPIWDLPSYWDTFVEEDRYFIDHCVRRNEPPLSSMDDVLTCLDILHAAEGSIESGSVQRL